MKVNIWRLVAIAGICFFLGGGLFGGLAVKMMIPHLKPDITISQIYKRKVKVTDQASFESNMNVEDLTQEANETETKIKNKKNRVRRRDRK